MALPLPRSGTPVLKGSSQRGPPRRHAGYGRAFRQERLLVSVFFCNEKKPTPITVPTNKELTPTTPRHQQPFPFRVQASVKAPESCAWSTRSEGGANLLGRDLDGNQIARKYRTCAGHADLLFRDGGKRQAGKCDCLLEFTSRPELSLRAARESGHNSMCQNGLKVLLRVTVRTKKRDSSAISSGVAALKCAVSTPIKDCPALLAR